MSLDNLTSLSNHYSSGRYGNPITMDTTTCDVFDNYLMLDQDNCCYLEKAQQRKVRAFGKPIGKPIADGCATASYTRKVDSKRSQDNNNHYSRKLDYTTAKQDKEHSRPDKTRIGSNEDLNKSYFYHGTDHGSRSTNSGSVTPKNELRRGAKLKAKRRRERIKATPKPLHRLRSYEAPVRGFLHYDLDLNLDDLVDLTPEEIDLDSLLEEQQVLDTTATSMATREATTRSLSTLPGWDYHSGGPSTSPLYRRMERQLCFCEDETEDMVARRITEDTSCVPDHARRITEDTSCVPDHARRIAEDTSSGPDHARRIAEDTEDTWSVLDDTRSVLGDSRDVLDDPVARGIMEDEVDRLYSLSRRRLMGTPTGTRSLDNGLDTIEELVAELYSFEDYTMLSHLRADRSHHHGNHSSNNSHSYDNAGFLDDQEPSGRTTDHPR